MLYRGPFCFGFKWLIPRASAGMLALVSSFQVQAEVDRAALEDFFQVTNGSEWVQSEGWGTDTSHCGWFGVDCDDEDRVVAVRLPNNGLTGELSGSLALLERLRHVDLSNNAIGGGLPTEWRDLQLESLQLGGNQFRDGILPGVLAMESGKLVTLDLADNDFVGFVVDSLLDLEFESGAADRIENAPVPLLDLCGNALAEPDTAELKAFLATHHHGNDYACIEADRTVTPEISGSWFDPERPGTGISQMLLDNGMLAVFWYTFGHPELMLSPDGQIWQAGLAATGRERIEIEPLHWARGNFGEGMLESGPQTGFGRVTITPTSPETEELAYSQFWLSTAARPGLAIYERKADRRQYERLTEMAGTTCANRHPDQWISGLWYNAERNGEGLVVEVLPDGRGLVYWYTFAADGSETQAWMLGTGRVENDVLTVDPLLQPLGGRFGAAFDPADVETREWGRLVLEFDDELSGRLKYDSAIDGYGAGDYSIERLGRPLLAECD